MANSESDIPPQAPWLGRAMSLFPFGVFLLTLGGLFTVYFAGANWPPIRADGVGYYAYLPSILIYDDPGFEELVRVLRPHYPIGPDEPLPEWTGIVRHPDTGRYLNKYPIGVALLASPFFAIAHGLALLFEQDSDGFTLQYQFTIALAGLCYVVLGLSLLLRILADDFGEGPAIVTSILILLGTNLFHYATYDSLFSHAFSFGLFVILLALLRRYHGGGGYGTAITLGITAGLLLLVRNTNLILLLTLPLYGLWGKANAREALGVWQRKRRAIPVILVFAILMVIPQLFYWKWATGSFLVRSYQGETFNFLEPEIFNVLFSARKGLFFWSPLLLIALAGCGVPRFRRHPMLLPLIVVFVLQTYLVASWWNWWYGGSFGHRAFVELLPLFAFPLAALFASIQAKPLRWGLYGFCSMLVLLNLIQMIQYWKRILPFDGITWEIYQEAFLEIMRGPLLGGGG